MRTLPALVISTLLGGMAWGGLAHAVQIAATPLELPSSAGTGLTGVFYDGVIIPELNVELDAFLAGNPAPIPSGSTRAQRINFGNGDVDSSVMTVSEWLNTSATTASPAGAGDLNIASTVWRFTGFIRIEAPSVQFALNSDDNSRLKIGGVTVIENDSAHSPQWATGLAEFANGNGLYEIEIVYFENDFGQANLELYSDIASTATACPNCFGAGGTGAAVYLVDEAILYAPVPLPPALLLLGGALPMLWRRRR